MLERRASHSTQDNPAAEAACSGRYHVRRRREFSLKLWRVRIIQGGAIDLNRGRKIDIFGRSAIASYHRNLLVFGRKGATRRASDEIQETHRQERGGIG